MNEVHHMSAINCGSLSDAIVRGRVDAVHPGYILVLSRSTVTAWQKEI
jgi:hypothetical protein